MDLVRPFKPGSILWLLAFVLFACSPISAQEKAGLNSIKFYIQNEATKEPVAGAVIANERLALRAYTDNAGRAQFNGIPNGEQAFDISSLGFETRRVVFSFPLTDPDEKLVLIRVTNEVGEVTISTTRTGREIDDEPTRVEAIDEEEIDEKSSMRSANVSMILNESTGIKVQQTSATSYTQSIRIQGLDGRYTQILKDGFPAFGGFSGSLSLLDIPPLDLKQVEIIKGASSTFYGGGAIAGVVNFISKEPIDEPVTSMILNQTSTLGTDFSIFNSRKNGRFGHTFLGSANFQKEYDVDDDDFTELPRTTSFTLNPRLFYYPNEKTRFVIGNSTTYQRRKGGDIFVIRGQSDSFHQYFENNISVRNITTLHLDRDFSNGSRLTAKQSFAVFDRNVEIPHYSFKGRQTNYYADLSYFYPLRKHALILGFNAVHDRFAEKRRQPDFPRRDEKRTTVGVYVQDAIDVTERLSLEAGLRVDGVKGYGIFVLPRLSVLYRFTDRLTTRIGFGLGYKAPSMFTEDAETLLFRGVLPLGDNLKAEKSRGGTFDINYRRIIGDDFSFSINQMFFYTEITEPLLLEPLSAGAFAFSNSSGSVRSSGLETNIRVSYNIVKLFAGYTFTHAKAGYLMDDQFLPLTPRNRINSALLLEKEDNFKAGIEAYYTGRQLLRDRSRTPDYRVLGIFGEKIFGKFSLFINAENITDTRQSRFGQVVFPPHQNPTFSEIYTHTEGRVFNGGIKIRL